MDGFIYKILNKVKWDNQTGLERIIFYVNIFEQRTGKPHITNRIQDLKCLALDKSLG
jgi:ornithine cyclodeaminase/alanine dehydrogenase-like protein (mu-crystallin family)